LLLTAMNGYLTTSTPDSIAKPRTGLIVEEGKGILLHFRKASGCAFYDYSFLNTYGNALLSQRMKDLSWEIPHTPTREESFEETSRIQTRISLTQKNAHTNSNTNSNSGTGKGTNTNANTNTNTNTNTQRYTQLRRGLSKRFAEKG
jgi:hypothetical protein